MLRLKPTLDRAGDRGRERCGVLNRNDGSDFEVLTLRLLYEVYERAARRMAEHEGVLQVIAKVAPERDGLTPIVGVHHETFDTAGTQFIGSFFVRFIVEVFAQGRRNDRGERLLRVDGVVFQSTDQRDRNINVELLGFCGHLLAFESSRAETQRVARRGSHRWYRHPIAKKPIGAIMPIPIRERGYPHPELLTEADWLASRLSDPTVRVVDARSGEDYAGGHIPGAVHLDGYTLGGLRTGSEMPEPEAFARLVGSLGIDERTTIVVYTADGPPTAGMVAWAFVYYGHPDTRLLDGGLTMWTAAGLPLSTDAPTHEPRTFAASPEESVYCLLDQVKASVDNDAVVFWDVRGVGEFEGTTKGWNAPPRLGHLPGAVHLDWTDLFDADSWTLKPAAELTTLLGAKGITPEATVVAY